MHPAIITWHQILSHCFRGRPPVWRTVLWHRGQLPHVVTRLGHLGGCPHPGCQEIWPCLLDSKQQQHRDIPHGRLSQLPDYYFGYKWREPGARLPTWICCIVSVKCSKVIIMFLTLFITALPAPSLTPLQTQLWSLVVQAPGPLLSGTGSRDGCRTSRLSSLGGSGTPAPASCHQGGWWVNIRGGKGDYYQDS